MKNLFVIIVSLLLATLNATAQNEHPEPKILTIGSQAPDFLLKGVDDKMYSLRDFSDAKILVIIFSCNHCPTAQAYENRIISIYDEFKTKGVQLVMISPNSPKTLNYWEMGWSDMGDEFEDMKIRAKDKNYQFPYLYDGDSQKISISYGPVATPHAFVFDKERKLCYVGRIDAFQDPEKGKGEDLHNAIDALLNGKKIENPITKVFGCSIKWAWKDEGTKKLYKQWSELPVELNEIGVDSVKALIRNKSENLRLINIWATWCGPCVQEFPDFIVIDRMYRSRQFEFVSISADKPVKKENVLKYLKKQEASNKNFIFNDENIYKLIEAVDPSWQGALPYTLLVEPGGKIIYSQQGQIIPLKIKKLIVNNKNIGG